MNVETMKLSWNVFPEQIWANLGLLLEETLIRSDNATGMEQETYRFLATAVEEILKTAESFSFERFISQTEDLDLELPKRQSNGFYLPEERPSYYEVNEDVKAFLCDLSDRETFDLVQRIFIRRMKSNTEDIASYIRPVIQEQYVAYLLNKSLGV